MIGDPPSLAAVKSTTMRPLKIVNEAFVGALGVVAGVAKTLALDKPTVLAVTALTNNS